MNEDLVHRRRCDCCPHHTMCGDNDHRRPCTVAAKVAQRAKRIKGVDVTDVCGQTDVRRDVRGDGPGDAETTL